MVLDAPRLGHAARRDDDDAPLAVQTLRLLHARGVAKAGEVEDISLGLDPGLGLGVVHFPVAAEDFGGSGGERAVDVDGHVVAALRADALEVVHHFLGPADRKCGDDHVAPARREPA